MGVMWGKQPGYKQSPPETIRPGSDGINASGNPFEIQKSECIKCLNISSRKYPAMSVRPGMTKECGTDTAVITKCNAAGARSNTWSDSSILIQNGTRWQVWAAFLHQWVNIDTSITDATGKILEFGTAADKFTILINGTYKKAWNGTGAPTDMTDAPATKYMCTDDARLYALDNNIIKCAALGSVTDWTTVNNAWWEPLAGMIGAGTAITAFNDMIIAFSDQTMHILMGNTWDDSSLSDVLNCGCVSDRSIVKYDGILYFMDYNMFKAFTGGLPFDISQKVKAYLTQINYSHREKIVAGNWDEYIYLSVPYGTSAIFNTITLEYNTKLKTWYAWDIGFVNFVNIGEFLYGIDTNGVCWKMQQGTADDFAADEPTAISWFFETGVFDVLPVRPGKTVSNYFALAHVPIGSTMKIEYSTTVDSDDWEDLYDFVASDAVQNVPIMIPTTILQDVKFYRLRVSGEGPGDLYYLESDKRIKIR